MQWLLYAALAVLALVFWKVTVVVMLCTGLWLTYAALVMTFTESQRLKEYEDKEELK